VTKDQCEVWAPVQDPQSTRGLVARWLGFELDQVTINVTLLGGAFGRKSKPDFVLEAVELAKRLRRPVRVQWLREDDIRHDFYHAASVQYHKALLDADGHPSAWLQRTAFPSITTTFSDQAVNPAPWELEMGFSNLPYRTPHQRFEYQGVRPGVRVGWMRSVCNVFHAFAANSFVDELAHAAGQDPIDYRLALLPSDAEAFAVPGMQAPQGHALDRSRLVNVTRRVRSLARWDEPRGPNRGLGFAVHHSFRSYVAMVVDVESTSAGHKVHDAFVVLDCGTFINPDTCRAQMEGAVVFGLSLALMGKMTVADGAVEQSNFHDYPMLRMPDCPDIHVELIESDALPAGVGEPGVPPVAPALTNAIYAASGKRIRTLPIRA
jgi:isoquinoline 1-oxidoreductase beta subunit